MSEELWVTFKKDKKGKERGAKELGIELPNQKTKREREIYILHTYTYTRTHTHIYMYIYILIVIECC